jgi:O-antigen/teichoic acid export membrane protein
MADDSHDRARATLERQIRRGVSWNAANLLVSKGMSILVRLLLARLLVPEHFGLIAMIVVLLGLVKIFVDFGLQNALIQRKRDLKSLIRYDSAFWILLCGGIGWTLLFAVAGIPLMIWLYDEPQLRDLALVMSFSILLHSLSIMPTVRLTRRMRFKSQVIAGVVSTVAASIIAIALAFAGAGAWALAGQLLSSDAIRSAMLWRAASWRPRRRFSWASLRDVVGFSGWMLGAQIVYYCRTNIDKVVIGATLGSSLLGIYTIAYLLTETLRKELATIIGKVMLPAYSKLQGNLVEIRRSYLSVTRVMCLLLFPPLLLLIVYSSAIIDFLFSDEWRDAASPVKVLALGGMIYAISGPTPEVMQGIGKARTLFIISTGNFLFIGLPAVYFLSVNFGLIGAAWAMTLTFASMRLISFFVLQTLIGIGLQDLAKAVGTAFISALGCGYTAYFLFPANMLAGAAVIILPFIAIGAFQMKSAFST